MHNAYQALLGISDSRAKKCWQKSGFVLEFVNSVDHFCYCMMVL